MCHVIMTLKFLILFGQGGRRFNLALGLMHVKQALSAV